MIVYENHGTYDYVHNDKLKCVNCQRKRPDKRAPGAYVCYGDCPYPD